MEPRMHLAITILLLASSLVAQDPKDTQQPLHRTVDLELGETARVELRDGSKVTVRLVGVSERRDSVRSAIREARVSVEINGEKADLVSGNYRLPIPVGGVQVDCIATKGLYQNHDPWEDSWELDQDARSRSG